MNKNKNKNRKDSNDVSFNAYCIFSDESQELNRIVGLLFNDYIESLKINKN